MKVIISHLPENANFGWAAEQRMLGEDIEVEQTATE